MEVLKTEEERNIYKLVSFGKITAHICLTSSPSINLYLTSDIEKQMKEVPGKHIFEIVQNLNDLYLYTKDSLKLYKEGNVKDNNGLDSENDFEEIADILYKSKEEEYVDRIFAKVGYNESNFLLDPFNKDLPIYRTIFTNYSSNKINIIALKKYVKKNKKLNLVTLTNLDYRLEYKPTKKEFYDGYAKYDENFIIHLINGLPEVKLSLL